jgi:GGDEF domain-containing protein
LKISHILQQQIKVSVSIGARDVPAEEQEDLNKQMSEADQALYLAKDNGRNCLMWF